MCMKGAFESAFTYKYDIHLEIQEPPMANRSL